MSERLPITLLALGLVAYCSIDARATTLVCVELGGDVAGVTATCLADAIGLEARKAGVSVRVAETTSEPRCLGSGRVLVRVGPAPTASIRRPSGGSSGLDLQTIEAPDRCASVARLVLAEPLEPADDGFADDAGAIELVDVDEAVSVPPSVDPAPVEPEVAAAATPPVDEPSPLAAGGALWVEGGYGFQPDVSAHRGTVAGELTFTLFGEQLALGVAGGWAQGAPVTRDDVQSEERGAELLAVVRGGFWAGPVLLRAGARAGWQWRWLSATTPFRVRPLEATSGAAAFDLDLEAAWAMTPWLRLGAVVRGRLYAGGADHTFAEAVVAPAPEGELDLSVRVGVTF